MARISRVQWKVWLAKHCEKCGHQLTQKALDGGRCMECRATIPVVEASNINELIKVAQSNKVGPGLPPRE